MNLSESCFNDIVQLVEFFITDEDSDLRNTKAIEGSKERHYKKDYYDQEKEKEDISKEQLPYEEELKGIYQQIASNAMKRRSLMKKNPNSPEIIELTKNNTELWKKLKEPLKQSLSLGNKIKNIQNKQDSSWNNWQEAKNKKSNVINQIKNNEEGK